MFKQPQLLCALVKLAKSCMAEAYTFIDPGGNKRFCFFPCGLNLEITSSYYYFEATNPLVRGDIGYEVIDVRIRGLVILCLI